MITDQRDTIAAIATPPGIGGIGIVRLSGSDALQIARKVFKPGRYKGSPTDGRKDVGEENDFEPRRLYHGYIIDPEALTDIDEVLIVYMPGPYSYTREDVLEIQAHGGAVALRSVLEIVVRLGARIAEPGEFTRRAYLNGRIDLSQAEAVIDVIESKTEASLRIASRNLGGSIRTSVEKMRRQLKEIMAIMAAAIDFPEDVDGEIDAKSLFRSMERDMIQPLHKILEGYQKGHLLRDGLKLVILGRANVGKSSLLNRLLQRDRAIVTSHPGTTRDSIEETLNLSGLPVVIVDTAGWRSADDPVEQMGIERTRILADQADLVLFMVDSGTGVVPEDNDIYEHIRHKEIFLVINKIDLMKGEASISIPSQWRFAERASISAKFDLGIDVMKERIFKKVLGEGGVYETGVVPNLRQKGLFEKALHAIEAAVNGFNQKLTPELIDIDLHEAAEALDDIVGITVKADLLDEIFSRFCIGK